MQKKIQLTQRLAIKRSLAAFLLLGLLGASCGDSPQPVAVEGPRAELENSIHDFGEVPQGTRIEHSFQVRNAGSEALIIEAVEAPEIVEVIAFDRSVPPGSQGRIHLALDTRGRSGAGELPIKIRTNDAEEPEKEVRFRGRLIPLIEIQPQNRVYFFSVLRGETPRKELTIVNHQNRPLKILEVEKESSSAVETRLETLEAGQSYRLEIELQDSQRPENRIQEQLTLVTDSPVLERIPIHLLATLENVVDTRPRKLFWGTFRLEDLDQPPLGEKRVLVAKRGGADFQILNVSTDISFIDLEVVPETPGQSYTVYLRIDPRKAQRGELKGELVVRTNDPEFPELKIPISGEIL